MGVSTTVLAGVPVVDDDGVVVVEDDCVADPAAFVATGVLLGVVLLLLQPIAPMVTVTAISPMAKNDDTFRMADLPP